MGSGYFGEPSLGNNERGGSSRKGKKSNSDKPKQPQRGLGVAQLEKIRLHGQMASDYHPSLYRTPYPTTFNQQEDIRVPTGYSPTAASSASFGYPNFMMGLGDYDRTNIRYGGDFQPSTAASWNSGHNIYEAQHYAQANATRHPLPLQVEDTPQKHSKKHRSSSMGSSSQNSESRDTQELDLELRLSI